MHLETMFRYLLFMKSSISYQYVHMDDSKGEMYFIPLKLKGLKIAKIPQTWPLSVQGVSFQLLMYFGEK